MIFVLRNLDSKQQREVIFDLNKYNALPEKEDLNLNIYYASKI